MTRFQTGGPVSHPMTHSMNSSVIDGGDYNSLRDFSMRNESLNMNSNYYDNR